MSDSPICVLLIEDVVEDVRLVREFLKREEELSLVIEDVSRLADGLRRLERPGIDVVLLDLGLPDSRGLDTVRQVLEHSPAVPVVVLSGADVMQTALRAVRAGAADYVFKGRMDGPLLARAIRFAVERAARRQAVTQLRESEERYRNLVETTSDWIWEIDERALFTYCNPRVKDLLGYRPQQLIGKSFFELVEPEQVSRIRQLVEQKMRRKSALLRLEHTNIHRDGQAVVLETSAVPVVDETGCLQGYRGIDRDITEVKAVQDSLRERERRYGQLLAAVTNYTYTVDVENGRSVWTTHGEGCIPVTGYTPSDYAMDPGLWLSMIHFDDRDAVLAQVDSALRGAEVKPIEHRIIHREGKVRWVRSTLVQHCEDGELRRYDGVIEDITERKLAEELVKHRELQLIAAQKIQKRLLPACPPTLEGYDIGGDLYPAEFAAGDYYDYLPMRDGALAVVIGDVSGHSFASALIMASAHVLLRLLVESHADVAEIFSLANSVLVKETEERRFVTMFLGRMDLATRSFTYANAAHPPGYVLDAEGQVKARMEATEIPLGIDAQAKYEVAGPVQLEGGDILVLVTDGILESKNPDDSRDYFRIERTLEVVRRHRKKSAQTIATRICQEARAFSKRKLPEDDTTAVVIKVLPSAQSPD
jgi:PAS domain S-box-containing protein